MQRVNHAVFVSKNLKIIMQSTYHMTFQINFEFPSEVSFVMFFTKGCDVIKEPNQAFKSQSEITVHLIFVRTADCEEIYSC